MFEIKPSKASIPPVRSVVVGEPGIGKTTFGSKIPQNQFICTEDGAEAIDGLYRIPNEGVLRSWDDTQKAMRAIYQQEHDRKNLVVDTIDGIVKLITEHNIKKMTEEKYSSYGRGMVADQHEFQKFLFACDALRRDKGMNIFMLAHAGLTRGSNVYGDDWQKESADMHKRCWNLLRNWSDQVAVCTREVVLREGKVVKGDRFKKRWMIFEGDSGRDAKSRVGYEMPERIEFSWENYAEAMGNRIQLT